MIRPLTTLALIAGALAACGGGDDGGTNAIGVGNAVVRRSPDPWSPAARGPVSFTQGTEIEATAAGVTVDAAIGDGARAEFVLGPGARLSRRNAYAFDLAIGTVAVRTTGMTDRMLIYHGDAYAEAGRVSPGDATFSVTAVGGQMAIVVERGAVQLNAIGATPTELHYVTLPAGEQGLAEKGARPQKIHTDDADAGPYLTPRVSLAVDATDALSIAVTVTIAPGESGAFRGLLAADDTPASPASLSLLASGEGGKRTIPVRSSHIGVDGALPNSVTATASEPFALEFDISDHGLSPGTWVLRARYLSYREHRDHTEWLGTVESTPVSVTIPD